METTHRTRTAPRPGSAATAATKSTQLSLPEPFNPYVLPTAGTARDWGRWGVQALVLSAIATLIWDRGASIRPEVKGQVKPFAAPAQWVSALVLGLGLFAVAAALGLPWGVIPLFAGAVVLTRRVLAALGVELTLENGMHQLIRKGLLVAAGLAAWGASLVLSGWLRGITASLASNPITKMAAGAEAASGITAQTSSIAGTILSTGTVVGWALVLTATTWWSVSTYLEVTRDRFPEAAILTVP